MATILIIEDEPSILLGLRDKLTMEGYEVQTAEDGEEGLRLALEGDHDLILLDIMLPKLDGYEICRRIRREGVDAPIIMLTAKGQEIDKVVGLELGADDYVTKPFSPRELVARIRARLRRRKRERKEIAVFRFADVEVDFEGYRVLKGGAPVQLSAMEFKVLKLLIENRGKAISRNRFLDEVWGYEQYPTTRTVDFHILKLRQKLEPNPGEPEYIVTVHGIGYRFDAR
jgi:two-component system alkaline phosphatase synthesis response regulator PhoP